MTTITLELDDKHAQQLMEQAQRSGESAEAWLRSRVEKAIEEAANFDAAANRVLEKNQELYERLA
jgi:predicted DNA-binding protein